MEALQVEARAAQSQVYGLMQHPLQSAMIPLLAPLIAVIVRSLRRSRAQSAAGDKAAGN